MSRNWMAGMCLLVCLPLGGLQASSLSEQYDAAMNAEHVLGDIPKAIKLFESVVAQAPEEQALLVKAQLGLANCQWKLNRHFDAIQTLDDILTQPAMPDLKAKAEQLRQAIVEQPLPLLDTPWHDNERLEYIEFYGKTRPVMQKTVVYQAKADNKGKKWEVSTVTVNLLNHAKILSQVRIDDFNMRLDTATLQGLREKPYVIVHDSVNQTTSIGQQGAKPDQISQPKHIQFELTTEQIIRRLALEEGQQVYFKQYSHSVLDHVEIAIERLEGNESITTEAGTFDAQRLQRTIVQNGNLLSKNEYWVSDDPRRLIVKTKSDFSEARLQLYFDDAATTASMYSSKHHHFSVMVPSGWKVYEKDTGDIYKFEALIYPFENQNIYGYAFSAGLNNAELNDMKNSMKPAVDAIAEWHNVNATHISKYVVDETNIREFSLANERALSYFVSYKDSGVEILEYRFLILIRSTLYQFFISGPPADIKRAMPAMEKMISSLKISKEMQDISKQEKELQKEKELQI